MSDTSIQRGQFLSCIIMLSSLATNPYKFHLFIYWTCFFAYGVVFVSLGPFIPYLTAQTGILQTQYSYLFTSRAVGMFSGAILHKIIQTSGKITHNQNFIGICIVMGVSCIFFSFNNETYSLIIWMVAQSVVAIMSDIEVNVCVMLISRPQEMEFWLMITHGMFGLGGLVGPIIVYLFEDNAFAVMGIVFLVLLPFFFMLKEPQRMASNDSKKQDKIVPIPEGADVLIGMYLFIYVGCETSYGAWISSYSILAGVSEKAEATFYATIYWIVITITRFISAIAPGTSSQKMRFLLRGVVLAGVICLTLIYSGYVHFTCYFGGIIFGMFFSCLYILSFSIATQFGYTILDHQTGSIILYGVLGEGTLVALVGKLMQYISINSLYYAIIAMALAMYLVMTKILVLFKQDLQSKKYSKSLGQELLQKKDIEG